MSQFYVSRGEDVYGPYDKDQLKACIDDGSLVADDYIFEDGWAESKTIREVFPEWQQKKLSLFQKGSVVGKEAEEVRDSGEDPVKAAEQAKAKKAKQEKKKDDKDGPATSEQVEYLRHNNLMMSKALNSVTKRQAAKIIARHKRGAAAGKFTKLIITLVLVVGFGGGGTFLYLDDRYKRTGFVQSAVRLYWSMPHMKHKEASMPVWAFELGEELSDEDYRKLIIGTWRQHEAKDDGTMSVKHTYHANGAAVWEGKASSDKGIDLPFNATGVWEVKDGYLRTNIKDSSMKLLIPITEEASNDEILNLNDEIFVYTNGEVATYLRRTSKPPADDEAAAEDGETKPAAAE